MTNPIIMPKYGLQQDEGTVIEWQKKEGDHVEKGDVLLEVETDKAIFEYEAPHAGYLRKILAQNGDVVPVLSTIAILTDTPDEPFEATDTVSTSPSAEPESKTEPTPDETPDASTTQNRIKRSPAAKRRANERNINLHTLTGTGPGGRIVQADVERAAKTISAGRTPLTKMRKAIGAAMTHSKQTIPHFYVAIEIDMTDAETWRQQQTPKPSVTDLLVKAAATSLVRFPALNSSLDNNDIITHSTVNIGLAVGTDNGLVVPVIPNAQQKTLSTLITDRTHLVEEARQGKLRGDTSATFTLSNLGMYGVTAFTAIVNPPEAAILAIGAAIPRVVPHGTPLTIAVRNIMTVTLSADHRIVDGLIAAQFLHALKQDLENLETIKGWT